MNAPAPWPSRHFSTRWQHADGTELANYPLFIADLCQLLGVAAPDPAGDNAYV